MNSHYPQPVSGGTGKLTLRIGYSYKKNYKPGAVFA